MTNIKQPQEQSWEKEFDEKFVEKIQISEDEFDIGFKGDVQELYNFISHIRREAVEREKNKIMSDYEKWCEETSWGDDESHRERLEEKMEFLLKSLSSKETK